MRNLRIVILSFMGIGLIFSFAFAKNHLPEERGKTIFNDPVFAGGKKSCNSCHPAGRGVENAGENKEFRIMGKKQKNLEEAVNFCIENANKGKAIDPKSEQMKDMVAYIKSLNPKAKKPPAASVK